MITLLVLFIATLFLAYSNGANDNFKGVATLFGSGTTSYKAAITWFTLWNRVNHARGEPSRRLGDLDDVAADVADCRDSQCHRLCN